jgi:hypothetical protein
VSVHPESRYFYLCLHTRRNYIISQVDIICAAVMCQILQLKDQRTDHRLRVMPIRYVTLGGEMAFNQPVNYIDWRFAQTFKLLAETQSNGDLGE